MSRQLAEILFKEKLISQVQLDEALQAATKDKNLSPMRYLTMNKKISENKLVEYLSRKYNIHSINLAKFEIDKRILQLIPPALAREQEMIPIQSKEGTVVVAVCDPTRLANVDKVKFATKLNVEAVLTTFSAFDEAISKYYGSSATISSALTGMKKTDPKDKGASLGLDLFEVHDIDENQKKEKFDSSGEAVITFVNGILGEAIRRGASDIHVEPYEKRFRVRMRIDGALQEIAEIPGDMKRAVVARMKIMSRMDIAEARIPQDGRIKLRTGGSEIDFRVNTLPTLFGEKVVMRMLSSGGLALDLNKLGFEAGQLEVFKKGIASPTGMVLVTGPTGSGKTTTLYSALAELNKITDNISTAEDPVEYNLEGINQTQINKDIGLTFAAVLRSMLRQDPDIILVGEIRDYETAEVSIQAALTGHLVLSTLHTNDAPSAVTRLMNMGIEPFLVTSSMNTIVAQRLLRKVCSKCKTEQPYPREKLVELGISPEKISSIRLYTGRGCPSCGNTGYKGRVAIYEVLDFNNELKQMVLEGASVIELRKKAVSNGMKTLRESALSRVIDGVTSLQEALAMTSAE